MFDTWRGYLITNTNTMNDELKQRAQAFFDDYKAVVEKHKFDFANYPSFVPDGQGGFKIIIQSTPVDISNQPVKSPLIATDAKKD